MKILLLLVLFFNTAQGVFAQRLRSGPTDLAVRVEILGRDIQPVYTKNLSKTENRVVLYAKVSLENRTYTGRVVVVMTCSWPDSWVSQGVYGICKRFPCEFNMPQPIMIPMGQALVFYSTLCINEDSNDGLKGKPITNRLGFMDLSFNDLPEHSLNKIVTVYWSNEFGGSTTKTVHIKSNGPLRPGDVERHFTQDEVTSGGHYVGPAGEGYQLGPAGK